MKAARTFGDYAAKWLAAQQLKVANGRLKQGSYDSYSGWPDPDRLGHGL